MSQDQMDGETLAASTTGFVDLIGAEIVEAGPDRTVMTLEVGEKHLQPAGILHGGVHCALVETAASIGAFLWLDGKGGVVGVNNTTNFLRSVTAGARLTVVATPIHRGRTQQLWLVEITNEAGKLVGRGEVRLHNLSTT